MERSVVPSVPVTLDRERTLRFDLNAMIAFEEKTGLSLLEGLPKKLPMRHVRTLLWAALLHEDPELTEQAAGAMLHAGNMGEVTRALFAAFRPGAASAQG